MAAGDTHTLRQQILRPHQPLHEMDWPGDDHPEAIHLVGFDGDTPVGMVSFFPDPRGSSAAKSYRLRGMGVIPERRSQGIGADLLTAGVDLVRRSGGDEVWCNARERAVPFYARNGFRTVGEFWDVPVIGPHVVMVRAAV